MKTNQAALGRTIIPGRAVPWQDFGFVLLGAVVLLLLMTTEGPRVLQPLRIVLGLAFTLFVPGYCLTTALFPRADDLDHVERAGLSLGFSISSVAVLALVLDRLPWGLRPWPILLGEYAMIGMLIGVSFWRRRHLPVELLHTGEFQHQPRSWWLSLPLSERRLFRGLLLIVPLLAILVVWVLLAPTPDTFTTEFYILGPDRLAAAYPYQVALPDAVKTQVGVINREQSEVKYHFEVWAADRLHSENRVKLTQSLAFSLRPGEEHEQSISWHMPRTGKDQEVELLLFYNDDSRPSRRLQMWIDVE